MFGVDRTDSDDWKEFISKPGLPYALRLLTGLSSGHAKTQVRRPCHCPVRNKYTMRTVQYVFILTNSYNQCDGNVSTYVNMSMLRCCVGIYVCMYIYMYIYIYIYIYTYIYTHTTSQH